MFLLRLAFKNIFRNKLRSVLTIVTVVAGVMGFVFLEGMLIGIDQTMTRVEIASEFQHLRVTAVGYTKDEEDFKLDLPVKQVDAVIKAVRSKWPATIPVKRIIFRCDVGDGVHSLPARGVAVDGRVAEQAYGFSRYTKRKSVLPAKGLFIMMGSGLADAFGKKPGDTITLVARTQAGSINALDFKILDVLSVGNTLVDVMSVYIPMATGRRLLEMERGVTGVVFKLPSKELSVAAQKVAATAAKGNEVKTWQEKTAYLIELTKLRRKMFNFLVVLILGMAAAGIANTILMSGFERKNEVGMMSALGMAEGRIMRLFATEACVLGAIGSVVGTIVGSLGTLYYQVAGFNIGAKADMMTKEISTVSMVSTIYFQLTPRAILIGLILGAIIAVLASLWPAWRITRFDPRETLAGG